MARVVCPSCKTGFEAKIGRENFAINCITCGIAFNAAAFLPTEDFQAVAERRMPVGRAAPEDGTRVLGNIIRPTPPIVPPKPAASDTRTGGLPFPAEPEEADTAAERDTGSSEGATETTTSFFDACITTSRFRPVRDDTAQKRVPERKSPSPPAEVAERSEPRRKAEEAELYESTSSAAGIPEKRGGNGTGPETREARSEAGDRPQASSKSEGAADRRTADASLASAAATDSSKPPREPVDKVARNAKRRPSPPLLEGAFGPFEIEGEIARGGVGAVFRAKETAGNRSVALKVLLDGEEAGEIERERFRRECETAKALALPGMVEIHAVGEVDGKPYMAM